MLLTGKRKRNRDRRPEGPKVRSWLPRIDWKRWGGSAIALIGIGCVVLAVRSALNQPIETVAVEGRFQRVSPLDVEKAVKRVSRGRGLVAVDLDEVSRAVQGISWVDQATVARSWPHGLSVFVVEQVPVARWGETGLLNTRGELFVNDARHIPAELPELSGPMGSEGLVTQRYLAAQGRLVEAGMRLSRVSLDPRGAWAFMLDNGVDLRLGRRDVDERFERFMAAGARIVGSRANDISYIDLRYANGFAIGWRTGKEGRNSG